MYLIFEFGPGVTKIHFVQGIHAKIVYFATHEGHWLVVAYVLDEE